VTILTASVCYVEKHFSKGVYIMQSLFGAVTMLLLSLSLGMGWRTLVHMQGDLGIALDKGPDHLGQRIACLGMGG
jgi:hypothetical protein